MKKEKLQQTPQKYEASQETTKSNTMPIKWTTWKKWTNSWKGRTFKTESRRIRKYEETNHKK